MYRRRKDRRGFDAEGSTEAAMIGTGHTKRPWDVCSEVRHGREEAEN